jgi:hypothetical protein
MYLNLRYSLKVNQSKHAKDIQVTFNLQLSSFGNFTFFAIMLQSTQKFRTNQNLI